MHKYLIQFITQFVTHDQFVTDLILSRQADKMVSSWMLQWAADGETPRWNAAVSGGRWDGDQLHCTLHARRGWQERHL